MQYKQLAAVAAFAGLANAQSQCLPIIQSFDGCLLGYVASAAYYNHQCDIVDLACQCNNLNDIAQEAIPAAGMPPSGATCGGIGTAFDVATNLCSCQTSFSTESVTLNALQSACEPLALSIAPCALGYIAKDANSKYGCEINDFECQCKNFGGIQGDVAVDVINLCGTASLNPVIASASALCACVTSQLSGGGSTSTGAGPTTTTTGSGPTSTGTGPTSSGSSAPSPSGSSVPSQTGGTSSKSGGSSPSASGTTSKSASGGPSGSQSSGASSPGTTPGPAKQSSTAGNNPGGSKSMPLFTNAGATASALGGIFGIVAGAVALL